MAKEKKPPRPWTVSAHGPLEQHDENLWSVASEIPGMEPFPRRMQIVRLSDRRLVFHNAIAVSDSVLAEIRALGAPSILIVPHRAHNMEGHAFREKLGLAVYCPAGEREAISRRVEVTGDYAQLPRDAALEVQMIEGAKREAVLIVSSGARRHLVFCDAFQNVPHLQGGARAHLMRIAGFTGGPRCPPLFRIAFTRDKKALGRTLRALSEMPGLASVIPSHGKAVTVDAARVLSVVATSLGG